MTRGPLPDDRLGTALLPLRVAGRTEGERRVLAAAEQTVLALRSVYACDPGASAMRVTATPGTGRLLRSCGNLAEVLWRTRSECPHRYAHLVTAVRAGCAGTVTDVLAEVGADGRVRGLLDRGDGVRTPMELLGDGELRYLALALVLLTGPGVLEVDPAGEVPAAYQSLTVLADGLDRGLDARQAGELVRLAERMCERGHIRLVAALSGAVPEFARRGRDGGRPDAVSELDVATLQRRLADFAAARNWQPFHTPKNLVAALSVEASELVEIFQWSTPEESARVMDDPDRAHRVRDEVADVLAYLLQLCEVLDIDPLAALDAKIDRNELRFPAPGAS